MEKFKIGDRVVAKTPVGDAGAINQHGTVIGFGSSRKSDAVEFDKNIGGHNCSALTSGHYAKAGHGWFVSDTCLELESERFKVGQIYRIEKSVHDKDWDGSIFKISGEKHEPFGGHFTTNPIRGKSPDYFDEGSIVAKNITLLTGSEIGEAIRNWDAEHAEKEPEYNEVKRRAKVGEKIKVVSPELPTGYEKGDIGTVTLSTDYGVRADFPTGNYGVWHREYVVLESRVKEVKRHAKAGEWVKVLTGDGHHAPVGGTFQVINAVDADGWVRVSLSGRDSTVLRTEQYAVLEGYKPEQNGEIHRKAKVGDTIRILPNASGLAAGFHPGSIVLIDGKKQNPDESGFIWGCGASFARNEYVVVSSGRQGKHSYTAEQIAEAKKLCGEMMAEAFDDGNTFNLRFLDKNRSESDNIVHCDVARLNRKADATGVAKCSDHDEYNVWIGRCVALCKALHKPIPAFIMGDGKGRHFDLEKAKRLGRRDAHCFVIHCKNSDETHALGKALDGRGYKWGSGDRLTEVFYESNTNYCIYDNFNVLRNQEEESSSVEFSDCFSED